MKLIDGKVAIITGASSGIGRAAAMLSAQQGASAVLVARRKDRLEELAHGIGEEGGQGLPIAGDVTQECTHKAAVAAARSRFGGLDIRFNDAGQVGAMKPLADMSPAR